MDVESKEDFQPGSAAAGNNTYGMNDVPPRASSLSTYFPSRFVTAHLTTAGKWVNISLLHAADSRFVLILQA